MKRSLITLLAAGFLASAASAQLVYNITGSTGVKATFTFTIDETADSVTVQIDNNVAGIGGAEGVITAFGFNTPFSDAQMGVNGANVTLSSQMIDGDVSTWSISEPWVVNPPEFNQEFGVSTDGSPNGGNPNGGIEFGETATFVFLFGGIGDITEAMFGGAQSLGVRFQSIDNTQSGSTSDKVWGTDEGGGGGSGSVPEPSTYGMFGALALLGLMVVRQVRRR
jgi:hypothetical protein